MENSEGVLALAGGSIGQRLAQEAPGVGRYQYHTLYAVTACLGP